MEEFRSWFAASVSRTPVINLVQTHRYDVYVPLQYEIIYSSTHHGNANLNGSDQPYIAHLQSYPDSFMKVDVLQVLWPLCKPASVEDLLGEPTSRMDHCEVRQLVISINAFPKSSHLAFLTFHDVRPTSDFVQTTFKLKRTASKWADKGGQVDEPARVEGQLPRLHALIA